MKRLYTITALQNIFQNFILELNYRKLRKKNSTLIIFQVFIQPFSTVIYMYSVFMSMQEPERYESKGIEVHHR